jgi:hypothetical protein
MNSFKSKFENNPTPENALLDQDALEDIYEEALTDKQREWALNRMRAHRRIFAPHLFNILHNSISYTLYDLLPWVAASGRLKRLKRFGIEDDLILNKAGNGLMEALNDNIRLDLSANEREQLIKVLHKTRKRDSTKKPGP